MNMKKSITLLSGLALAISLPVSSALADTATVTAEKSANIRAGAGMNHPVIGWAMKGDTLETLGETGKWTRVQLKGGKEGYIYTSLLSTGSTGGSSVSSTATITAEKSANVRAEANTKSAVIGWAMKGDKVTVLEKGAKWSKVQLKNGKVGYIHNSFIGGASSEGSGESTAATATITAEKSANVRAEASAKSDIVGWAMKGDKVTVLEKGAKWSKVQLKNGKVGYIHNSFIGGASSEGSGESTAATATITAEKSANVRAEASAKSEVIGWAMKGDKVTVLGKSGNWLKVQLKSGKVGYIHSDYCAE